MRIFIWVNTKNQWKAPSWDVSKRKACRVCYPAPNKADEKKTAK